MASLSKEIPEKDPVQLRKFWRDTALILAVIAAIAYALPMLRHTEPKAWPPYVLVASIVIAVMAFVLPPPVLRVLYKTYMLPFVAIGMVMSRVVLGILFFAVVFPVGLLMRAMGKDPMRRTMDKAAPSYRNPSQNPSKESVEAPF